MVHRFFVAPETIIQGRVAFDAATAHQLRNVLRMRPGDQVVVLDGSGQEYEVELTEIGRETALGVVHTQRSAHTEPRLSLTLYQSLLKGDRFEWVLQKGTELGVHTFVPVLSQRSVFADVGRAEKKLPRWRRILREAAEQSHRGRLPDLCAPMTFTQACEASVGNHQMSLMPWEEAAGESLWDILRSATNPPSSLALLIGPEGGFHPQEAALAQGCGIQVVTLGPRILRAETAAVASVAIALAALGEMETPDASTSWRCGCESRVRLAPGEGRGGLQPGDDAHGGPDRQVWRCRSGFL